MNRTCGTYCDGELGTRLAGRTQPVSVTYTVTDGDNDTASGTLTFNVEDDGISTTGTAVVWDETLGTSGDGSWPVRAS